MLPLPQGPIINRPGTEYVATSTLSQKVKLIPHTNSTGVNTMIEMGEYAFYFYDADGPEGTDVTISAVDRTTYPHTLVKKDATDTTTVSTGDILRFSANNGLTGLSGDLVAANLWCTFAYTASGGASQGRITIISAYNNSPLEYWPGCYVEVGDVFSFVKPPGAANSSLSLTPFETGLNTLNSDGTVFYKVSAVHSSTLYAGPYYSHDITFTNYDGSATTYNGRVSGLNLCEAVLVKFRDKFMVNPTSSTAWRARTGTQSATAGTFTSGTFKKVGKAHSYSQSEIFSGSYFNLGIDNQGDTVMFSNSTQWPKKLTRNGDADWTFGTNRAGFTPIYAYGASWVQAVEMIEEGSTYPYFKDGPYLPEGSVRDGKSRAIVYGYNDTPTTFTIGPPAVLSNTSDIGRNIRFTPMNADAGTRNAIVRAVETNKIVGTCVNIGGETTASATTDQIRFGAYGAIPGYPKRVAFFQNRLVYAGLPFDQFRVDCSKSNEYTCFSPTNQRDLSKIPDNYAITLTPESKGGKLQAMVVAGRALVMLGSGDIFAIHSSDGSQTLSPAGVVSVSAKNYGAEPVLPAVLGNNCFFIGSQGRKLYSAEFDGGDIKVSDRSLLSHHIMYGGIVDMTYQAAPYGIIWMVRADGTLVAYTVDDAQQIAAFSRHTIGGAFGSGTAVVESVSALPADGSPFTDLWMVVKRTINGATVRHVEKLAGSNFFDDTITQDAVVCSDSSVTYSGAATVDPFTTELLHLRGSTLALVADGKVITGKTASATGALSSSLSAAASTVVAGLSYTPEFETTSLEVMGQNGPSVGLKKRINKITVGVSDTSWFTVGPTSSDQKNIETGNAIIPTSAKITWTTQGYTQQFAGDITQDARVYIKQPYPLPICITYIHAEGEIYGR
jgi:hypothetical protein